MRKRILFRLHGIHAKEIAEECKVFIKDYFELHNKRVKLSVELQVIQGLPYDLYIFTASDEAERIAHAAGWSYLKGIETLRPLYTAGMTTFHHNERLASELKRASIHFERARNEAE